MPLLEFEEFKRNQQLEFEQRARLCRELTDGYGFAPQDLEEGDRRAFRRVFDLIAREGYVFQLQLHSPSALLAAYVEYLEREALEWVSDLADEHEDTSTAGCEHADADREASASHGLYEEINRLRERLRATLDAKDPMPPPWINPFILEEERPASEQWPEESAALDAHDSTQLFPWLLLETEPDFRAFANTEAGRFLREDEVWEPHEVRASRAREYQMFLAWILGASTQHPAPTAVRHAWRRWRPPDRRGS